MKEKLIETAGKAWRVLGEKGETAIPELAKILRESEQTVNQAIGWLAREDKINLATKRNATFVSLVENELSAFKNLYKNSLTRGQESPAVARRK